MEGAEAAVHTAGNMPENSDNSGVLAALLDKAAADQAALIAARHCKQVLCGIGFTAEHQLHRHIKCSLTLDELLDSARTDPGCRSNVVH
ncbi:hypothetical protein [Mycobacterium lepromatosis]|uniref:hypothetical protein n=1 Tax=Mycobacterium lepromatosis TaxID=480418 RepID=UPI003D805B57